MDGGSQKSVLKTIGKINEVQLGLISTSTSDVVIEPAWCHP